MRRHNIITTAEVNAVLAQIKARAPESADIQKLRTDAAKSDLRRVKRCNTLGIGQTEVGFVELTHVDGVYMLTKGVVDGVANGEPKTDLIVLAKGAPRVVAPVLASVYSVEA